MGDVKEDHQYSLGKIVTPTLPKPLNVSSLFKGRRCFICNEPLKGNACHLGRTNTRYTNTPFSKCLNDVMGDSFEVIVGDSDKSCQRCAALVQQRDRLSKDLEGVNKALKGFLTRKYTLLSLVNHQTPTNVLQLGKQIKIASVGHFGKNMVHQPQNILLKNDTVESSMTNQQKSRVMIVGKVAQKVQNKPMIPINKPVELYQCVQCHHMTTDQNELKNHSCIKTSLVSLTTTTPVEKSKPLKKMKTTPVKVPPSLAPMPINKFNCNFCHLTFSSSEELDDHHDIHIAGMTQISEQEITITEEQTTQILESVTKASTLEQAYTCSSCSESFSSLENLKSHLTPMLKINTGHCHSCDITFTSKEDFNNHITTVHQIGNEPNPDNQLVMKLIYTCSCCQFETDGYKGFNDHKEEHISQAIKENAKIGTLCNEEVEHDYAMDISEPSTSQTEPNMPEKDKENNATPLLTSASKKSVYECGMCNIQTESIDTLIEHFNIHKTSKIQCKYCHIIMPSVNALSKHLQYHTKPGHSVGCQICIPSVPLNTKDALMKHMADLHKMKHQCNFCGEQFRFNRELLIHQNQHPESKRFCCPECDMRFLKFTQLKKHLETQHRDPRCRYCSKVIRIPAKLRQHEARHRNEKYSCTKCERIFKTPSGLRNHMAIHTGEYKYRCDTCERGFMNRNIFIEHTNNHLENPKPLYKCDICSKNFFYKGSLWIHQKWHKNPYPYECKLCGKKLRHASVLQLHMRKHRGERPYKCPYCPLNFNSPSTFKRHLMLHTGEYAYRCEECNKGFTGKNKYQLHRYQVHGEPMPKRQPMTEQDYKVNVPVQTLESAPTLDNSPAQYVVESVEVDPMQGDTDSIPRMVEVIIDEEQQAVSSITLLADPTRWA